MTAGPDRSVDRSGMPYRLAFSGCVAGLMSVIIGGATSLLKGGAEGALSAWLDTAPVAFVVAFPTSLFVVPFVQERLDRAFATSSEVDG